jgi:hypothetical protein
MLDVETPNFHARSAAGEVILSPMAQSDYDMRHEPARVNYTLHKNTSSAGLNREWLDVPVPAFFNDKFKVEAVNDPGSMFDPSDDDRNEAIASAWANVDESEIQLLASLGEFPETLRWIASIYRRSLTVIRLYNRKRSFLKAVYFAARKTSKREYANLGSELWLEYRYAFRPLVFEMKQAVEALHSIISKNDRHTGRGYKFCESTNFSNYENSESNDRVFVQFDRTECTWTQYCAGVLYRIENDLSNALTVWGIDQPLESAWELIPFSFIIDWFINIGDLLSAWTDNTGLTPLGSWIVERHTYTVKDVATQATRVVAPTGYTNVGDPYLTANGSYNFIGTYARRVINPPRSFIPSIKMNLDMAKILDLTTIIRALMGNGGRVKIGGSNVR